MQPLSISNECKRGVEKYVQNVVDDVMRSHYVVVVNSLSMLCSGMYYRVMYFSANWWEEYFEKNGKMQKLQTLVDKTHLRIRGKVEKSSAPNDME